MGMSASQARYLSLIAQQSNLEYQGQQINQERTILSQQVSDLYNTLLALDVPTPPSTQEFTQVVYKCNVGASNYSFKASDIKPGANGTYNITLQSKGFGDSLTRNPGYVTVAPLAPVKGTDMPAQSYQPLAGAYQQEYATLSDQATYHSTYISGDKFMRITAYTETLQPPDPTGYYIPVDTDGTGYLEYIPATPTNISDYGYTGSIYQLFTSNPASPDDYDHTLDWIVSDAQTLQNTPVPNNDLTDLYIIDNSGYIRPATTADVYTDAQGHMYLDPTLNLSYFYADGSGTDEYMIVPDSNPNDDFSIGGNPAMTLDYALAQNYINQEDYNCYVAAIENANLCDSDGNPFNKDEFFIYFDSNNKIHFALKTDVENNDATTITYDYYPNGEMTQTEIKKGCLLEFDPSSGRIVKVNIPASVNPNTGEVESYTGVTLEAVTETDTLAYENAMAQYQYQQYLYDQEQANINAKTEKIQQMDRNLELKLQRLDTQRTQITTELEAVKKVMDENIESSYKCFNA
ncbi:hypothetical protein IKB17_07035 [bacterium]|nr:hypothetical protein [bacterium]